MADEKKNIDRVTWWGVVAGITVWLLGMIIILWNWRRLPPQLPLLYSLPRSEQQLVSRGGFVLALVIGGVCFGLNIGLAYYLGKEERLVKRFLVYGGVMALILLVLTVGRIMTIIL